MKSLNTSLPRSPRRKRSHPPPEKLIQSFKTAALSVTNLYKIAAADQSRAREEGYQDALDDLLTFLDKENLGLDDGEGWKVRQWATERLDGTPPAHIGSDSDDDRGETSKRARSSSPVTQRTTGQEADQQSSRSTSPVQAASAPMVPPAAPQQHGSLFQVPEVFSFQSAHPYPHDIDMQTLETAGNITTPSEPQPPATSGQSVRVEVLPRPSRTPHRGGNLQSRRSATGGRSLVSGAGSKRKIPFGDYFDLSSLGDSKDGQGGGGKRGRFS